MNGDPDCCALPAAPRPAHTAGASPAAVRESDTSFFVPPPSGRRASPAHGAAWPGESLHHSPPRYIEDTGELPAAEWPLDDACVHAVVAKCLEDADAVGGHAYAHSAAAEGAGMARHDSGSSAGAGGVSRVGVCHESSESDARKTLVCTYFLKESGCKRGRRCPFLHVGSPPQKGAAPQQPPQLSVTGNPLLKTRMCPLFRSGQCKRTSEQCKFAHSVEELRHTEELFKTQMCAFWLAGNCRMGHMCRHAHGNHELRKQSAGGDSDSQRDHHDPLAAALMSAGGQAPCSVMWLKQGDKYRPVPVPAAVSLSRAESAATSAATAHPPTYDAHSALFAPMHSVAPPAPPPGSPPASSLSAHRSTRRNHTYAHAGQSLAAMPPVRHLSQQADPTHYPPTAHHTYTADVPVHTPSCGVRDRSALAAYVLPDAAPPSFWE